jgi:hypothetical protein
MIQKVPAKVGQGPRFLPLGYYDTFMIQPILLGEGQADKCCLSSAMFSKPKDESVSISVVYYLCAV